MTTWNSSFSGRDSSESLWLEEASFPEPLLESCCWPLFFPFLPLCLLDFRFACFPRFPLATESSESFWSVAFSFPDSSEVEKFKVPNPGSLGCLTVGVESFGSLEVKGRLDAGGSVAEKRARLLVDAADVDGSIYKI